MYTQSITRNHRTAFILAIDCSGSMAESILFRGRRLTKAEAVAGITNDLLFELVERARRSDGIRDYYDIAVIGYSGDDEVLRAVCNQIKALETVDGNVLLINIHIAAGDAGRHVFFPEAHEANYTNRYAALLYDCSSEMPAVFNEAIREAKGPAAAPPFRGMSYNASAAQLVTMLNIGSISVKTE